MPRGISRLVEVAGKNYPDVLKILLSSEGGGFSTEELDTALQRAACYGNVKCLILLLEHGADPDAADPDGDTPLILSVANKKINTTIALLKLGCDVDTTNCSGRSALHMAAWNGNYSAVLLLFESGCDPTIREKYGDTVVMLAALNGHDDVLSFLIEKNCDIHTKNYEKDTALHYAARKGRKRCVELLLKAGADVNCQNEWGINPLMLAISKDHREVVKLLLDADCDVTQVCNSMRSALHYSAQHGLRRCTRALLKKLAPVDIRDSSENTPLMDAVYHNHLSIVKMLVKAGCSVNFIGKSSVLDTLTKCTPLDVALDRRYYEIAQVLILAVPVPYMLHPDVLQELPDRCKDPVKLTWFVDRICGTSLLQELCRLQIRHSIGHQCENYLEELPLPPRIIKYLAFEEYGSINKK